MPSKTQSILLGGVVAAIAGALVSFVPFVGNCLGCLAYIVAGLVSVWHYTDTHTLTISGGSGAGMGAAAGLVAGLISLLITFLLQMLGVLPGFSEVLDEMRASGQLPPDQIQTLEGFANSPAFMIGVALFVLIIGAIMGTIGGAIGASVFKRGGDTPGHGHNGGPTAGPQGPSPGPEGRSATPERPAPDAPAEPTTEEPATEPRNR